MGKKDVNNGNLTNYKSLYDCLNETLVGGGVVWQGGRGAGGSEMRNLGTSVSIQMQAEELKGFNLTARWNGI